MMDPVINKLNTTLPDSLSKEIAEQPGKAGASKFDQVRRKLKTNAGKELQSASPDATVKLPAAENAAVVDRTQRPAAVPPSEHVKDSLSASRYHMVRLKERVESTPVDAPVSGLQSRLASIERQYSLIDAAARAMPATATPQQWITLQQQVYSMDEDIGVLSKMVSQAASGVKSVLQTQV